MEDSEEDDKKSEGDYLDQISELNKQVHKKDEKIMDMKEKYDELRESNKQLKLEIKKLTKQLEKTKMGGNAQSERTVLGKASDMQSSYEGTVIGKAIEVNSSSNMSHGTVMKPGSSQRFGQSSDDNFLQI